MNSFLPSAKRHRALSGILLAVLVLLSGGSVPSLRAEEEDPGPVDRVVNFFKGLEEKKKERERAREAPPVRAVPVDEPPQGSSRARSSGSNGQSLDTPPSSQSSTKRKPTRSSSSKSSTAEPKNSDREPTIAKRGSESESQESEAPESSSKEMKPAPDLDAARKELAELKRKVAAMEAQLGEGAGVPNGQNQEGVAPTTPLPAPISPPRNVASTPAYESKKPFSNGAEVTLKLPDQGVNTGGNGGTTAPGSTTAAAGGTPPTTSSSTPPAASVPSDSVPIGTKTDKPGIVKSPHAPFNEIDVNGLQKGVLAKDPTTQKIFRIP
jgi:hypothetical protein